MLSTDQRRPPMEICLLTMASDMWPYISSNAIKVEVQSKIQIVFHLFIYSEPLYSASTQRRPQLSLIEGKQSSSVCRKCTLNA